MNFDIIEHLYEPQSVLNNTFDNVQQFTTWTTNYWTLISIAQFLRTRVITEKSKWKCKACQIKILEPKQIQTSETHVPVYHAKCYMELRHACVEKINEHESYVENQINIMQEKLNTLVATT